MKKSYFILAAVAATFAACSQNDVITEITENEVPIGFNSDWVENVTRNAGEIANKAALEVNGNTMQVWGWKTYNSTDTKVFNAQVVTYNSSSSQTTTKWEYNPLKFWDKAASYKFYGAAPDAKFTLTDDTRIFSAASVPAVQVLADNNGASQVTAAASTAVDYLLAPVIERPAPKGNATDGDVAFTFNHILSKLLVNTLTTATFNNSGTTYPQIKLESLSVKLEGMCPTYTQKAAGVVNASATDGDTWSGTALTATDYACFNVGGPVAEQLLSTTAFETASYLVAPTATGATPATCDVKVTVKYKVYYSATESEEFERTDVAVTGITSFVQNTFYTLNVTVGPEAIYFDVETVNDWTVGAAGTVVVD